MGIHWTGIVFGLGFAISFGYWTTDFLVVQRVLAAHNLRSARMAPIIGSFFKMAVPFIVILPGLLGSGAAAEPRRQPRQLVLRTHGRPAFRCPAVGPTLKTNLPFAGSSKGCARPEGRAAVRLHSYNEVLPLMMVRYLGPGLLGLGITALIAGFMSGMAGNVSAFSAVWTYDIYQAAHQQARFRQHYVAVGRWAIDCSASSSPSGPRYLVMTRARNHGLCAGAVQVLHLAACWA